jgi:hypothetical protein
MNKSNNNQTKTCDVCNEKYYKSYTIVLNNKSMAVCYLCKNTENFTLESIGKCILVRCNLKQIDINKLTLKYVNTHDEIPNIIEFDKNCKLINFNIFSFMEIIKLMNKKEKKIFENVKIMFTNESLKYLKSMQKNYFTNTKIIKKKYDNDFFNIEKYSFSKKENEIINNIKILLNENIELNKIKKSLNDKANNSHNLFMLLNTFK